MTTCSVDEMFHGNVLTHALLQFFKELESFQSDAISVPKDFFNNVPIMPNIKDHEGIFWNYTYAILYKKKTYNQVQIRVLCVNIIWLNYIRRQFKRSFSTCMHCFIRQWMNEWKLLFTEEDSFNQTTDIPWGPRRIVLFSILVCYMYVCMYMYL